MWLWLLLLQEVFDLSLPTGKELLGGLSTSEIVSRDGLVLRLELVGERQNTCS